MLAQLAGTTGAACLLLLSGQPVDCVQAHVNVTAALSEWQPGHTMQRFKHAAGTDLAADRRSCEGRPI
jgi:hypothetical protein